MPCCGSGGREYPHAVGAASCPLAYLSQTYKPGVYGGLTLVFGAATEATRQFFGPTGCSGFVRRDERR